MKKTLIILLCAVAGSISGRAQKITDTNAKLEKQIIALDRSGWEAWKNKNAGWFRNNTTKEFLSISAEGISDKAQVISSTPTDCNVKSYSLNDFKFVILNENTVLLTYTAMQDGECGGKKIASKVRAAVTYVKHGKRWLEACYMDTPIEQ